MKTGDFGYWTDSLFLLAASLYALNRWVLKPHLTSPFLHGHFNDLLLVPAALPVVLWIQRQTRLRQTDDYPTWQEVFLHLAVWSVICEGIGPFWLKAGTSDPVDVLCYAIGAGISCAWWNRKAMQSSPKKLSS